MLIQKSKKRPFTLHYVLLSMWAVIVILPIWTMIINSFKTKYDIYEAPFSLPKKWIFEKIWDRLEIPKPFSKNIHFVGKPFYIDKKTPLEEATEIVKKNIHDAGMKAYEIYKEKYLEK